MSTKFGVFGLIIANVENVQLIRIVKNHYVDDQWNTIKDLHGLESLESLSQYDRLVSRSFLARSLSLESSFRRSERVFQNCIAMLPSNLKSKHEKAIARFFFIIMQFSWVIQERKITPNTLDTLQKLKNYIKT